jgi:hypothetical protein
MQPKYIFAHPSETVDGENVELGLQALAADPYNSILPIRAELKKQRT